MNRHAQALALALLALPARAGEPWELQSPWPTTFHYLGAATLSSGRTVIVGDDHILMHSDDGGRTWVQSPSVPRIPGVWEDPLYEVRFADDRTGFVFGNDNFRTTDGGDTWQPIQFLGSVRGADVVTAQTAFAWWGLGMYRTADGGDHWTSIWSDIVTCADFLDESYGLLSGGPSHALGVYRTTDGGRNWTRVFAGSTFQRLLILSDSLVLATRNNVMHRSVDDGVTWTTLFSSPKSFECITRIDSDSVAAVDIAYRVYVSDDLGVTWTQTHEALGDWISGGSGGVGGRTSRLAFSPDGRTGYLAKEFGAILKSTDGGHSWTRISKGAALTVNSLAMTSGGVGIGAGEWGTILRTTDFGRTWSPGQVPDTAPWLPLNAVQAIDADTFVAAGHEGRFYRSDDAGRSWSHMSGGIDPVWDPYDLHFLGGNRGWLFCWASTGLFGMIYRTTDGGASWTPLFGNQEIGVLEKGQMIDALRGYALSPQTTLYKTTDGWQNVTVRDLPGASEVYTEMGFAGADVDTSADVGWIAGRFGTVLRTTDGGATFQLQTLPGFDWKDGDVILDLRVLDANTAYVSTKPRGIVYRTTDGGATWTALDPRFIDPDNDTIPLAIDALPTGRTWLAGYKGMILASAIPADVNGDGVVDFADLLELLAAWGPCQPEGECPADLDGSGSVDFGDLLILLANWS